MRDVRFALFELVRQSEGDGTVTLYLSRSDAARVVNGIQEVNAAIQGPDDIDKVEGVSDGRGEMVFRLDERLPKGVASIENRNGTRKRLSLPSMRF